MSKVTVLKPRPLFRDVLRTVPAAPIGTRVFVRPHPIAGENEAGIVTPDEAKRRQMAGTLVAAGDSAADTLYDYGVELGDEIWYGKYAGIIEEWQHIVKDGRGSCQHDGAWDHVPKRVSSITDKEVKYDARWSGLNIDDDAELRECRTCGALRLSERMIIMDVADIVCSVDLQVRLERGVVQRERQTNAEGKTRYVLIRPEVYVDKFEKKEAA